MGIVLIFDKGLKTCIYGVGTSLKMIKLRGK